MGNTLVSADEQEGKLHLTLRYAPARDERAKIQKFIVAFHPGRKVCQFRGVRIIIG